MKLTEGIQHKLLLKLLGYNFTIEYKNGKENKVAHALSRVKYWTSMLVASNVTPTWVLEVVKSYSQDEKIKEWITQCAVDSGTNGSYSYKNGILRFKGKVKVRQATELRQELVKTFHNSELGATLVRELLIKELNWCFTVLG